MARLTFEQEFWLHTLDGKAIIIEGNCYHVGNENTQGMRGFGGDKFVIQMTCNTAAYREGDIITTTNLWHNGRVPAWCNVTDNAKFVIC